MRKRIVLVCIAMLLCTLTAFADDGVVVQTVPAVQSAAIGAKAGIVMEAMTGRVLFAQSAHARLPVASTTKILTALLTLEQPDLDTVFEVDTAAITVEGSSMGLVAGDKVTLRTLAIGMLLASGNDAANAAAVRVGGSIPAFVALMNQRVKEIGLENTSFETPSGLDGENHYSSAYDMAMITREALKNPDFAAICSQYKMRTSYGNPPYDRWLTNHNRLLSYYEGTIGVKTGFTKKAGRCLVSAARRDGVDLVCVTLDCPDDWSVHRSLYERYFGRVQIEDLSKDLPVQCVPVTGGTAASVPAIKLDVAQVPVPVDDWEVAYKFRIQPFLYAPVSKGQYVGEADIYVDGKMMTTMQLVAQNDVPLLNEYVEEFDFWKWLGALFHKE